MARPTKDKTNRDKHISIRVTSDLKEQIVEEASKQKITITELMLKGYDTLKEGKYIDFK